MELDIVLILRTVATVLIILGLGYVFQKWMRQKFPTIPPPYDVDKPPNDATEEVSGLYTRVLAEGTGDSHPVATSTVTVQYTGWQTDGLMFDSSVTRGKPATFKVNQLIKGWQEGLQLMVEGENRRMWIPEDLAYGGSKGGPSGMLVFDVYLLKIHDD